MPDPAVQKERGDNLPNVLPPEEDVGVKREQMLEEGPWLVVVLLSVVAHAVSSVVLPSRQSFCRPVAERFPSSIHSFIVNG
jgi:hypothetical protein